MKRSILASTLTLALTLILNACSGSSNSTPNTNGGDGDGDVGDGDVGDGDTGDGDTGDGDVGDGDVGDGDVGDGDVGDGDVGDGDTGDGDGEGTGDGDFIGDGDIIGDGDFTGDGDIMGDGDGDDGCSEVSFYSVHAVVEGGGAIRLEDPTPANNERPGSIALPPPSDCRATVVAVDEEFDEELTCVGGIPTSNDCICYGVSDRPGTYSVTASLGELQETQEISVVEGECSLEPHYLIFFEESATSN